MHFLNVSSFWMLDETAIPLKRSNWKCGPMGAMKLNESSTQSTRDRFSHLSHSRNYHQFTSLPFQNWSLPFIPIAYSSLTPFKQWKTGSASLNISFEETKNNDCRERNWSDSSYAPTDFNFVFFYPRSRPLRRLILSNIWDRISRRF